MPGLYRANPSATATTGRLGRAGLALPFTPTIGSLRFRQDHSDYLDSPMVEGFYNNKSPWVGNASDLPKGGIKTSGMDNCVVVCISELNGALGKGTNWGYSFFAHLPGGNWDMFDLRKKLEQYSWCVEKSRCYSLVMANFDGGLVETLKELFDFKFPVELMSVYVSNLGAIDVAVEFKNIGEFGEISWSDPRKHNGPYGVVTTGDPREYFNGNLMY